MFDMIGNIIKNVFSKPATRLYPYAKREPFPNVRGQICGIDQDTCNYCGLCAKKCPALAINVDRANKTWSLNPYKCVVCGVCEESCVKKSVKGDNHYRAPASVKQNVNLTLPAAPPAAAAQASESEQ